MIISMSILAVILIVIVSLMIRRQCIKNKTKISFKESLDLTGLPVITFYHADKKFNFLLDTGSSLSVINEKELSKLDHKEVEGLQGEVMGMEGNYIKTKFTTIDLYFKDRKYTDDFQVVDISGALDSIKQETGVTVSGILGSSFFQKYKYVLDFNDLAAYCK